MKDSFINCDMEVINIYNHHQTEDMTEKKWAILVVVRVSNKF